MVSLKNIIKRVNILILSEIVATIYNYSLAYIVNVYINLHFKLHTVKIKKFFHNEKTLSYVGLVNQNTFGKKLLYYFYLLLKIPAICFLLFEPQKIVVQIIYIMCTFTIYLSI